MILKFIISTVLVAIYLPITVVGYYVYGDNLNVNVTLTISSGIKRTLAQALLAGHLFFSFILVVNPPMQELEEKFKIKNSKRIMNLLHQCEF